MNGAETILRAAVDAGITACFANPGTTEMPFVAAMDTTPGLRSVLCLAESVCTGAADGYARIAGAPAMTLLHLGPGLANGLANLHNARRAGTPVLNLIGEHTTWIRDLDPPLNSDIDALAGVVCTRTARLNDSETLRDDLRELLGYTHASPGPVAAVIPHDVQLAEVPDRDLSIQPAQGCAAVSDALLDEAAAAIVRGEAALILGGDALSEAGLSAAARIAEARDVGVFCGAFPSRIERGRGRFSPRRLPYFPEHVLAALDPFRTIVLIGESVPVAFFGYPGYPGKLVRDDQHLITLADPTGPALAAVQALADQVGRPATQPLTSVAAPLSVPEGRITRQTLVEAIAYVQPEDAIIVDEGATSTGDLYFRRSARSLPHTYLTITGGAIGFGMPCATGAALAGGGRRVLAIQADGSAMYTLQALWTQAREGCNVTTVICNNSSYAILGLELDRAGIKPGPVANDMVTLLPSLDWVALARGMGVPALAVDDAQSLVAALERALQEPGPQLIQAQMTD